MTHTGFITTLRAAGALLVVFALFRSTATQTPAKHWYKGNLHTHTTNSDGDSTPEEVATWYKEHGYQFLILSDHNKLTDPAPLNARLAEPEKYLLIQGEEVTSLADKRPAHVNGYGVRELVQPAQGLDMPATLQFNVNGIRKAGGLPSVNHPNYGWAMTSADLLKVSNLSMLEVYNGHPQVHNRGGGGAESLEQMWDALLTAGKRVHGIAVDDAHNFKRFDKELSNPGRGWVQVRAAKLTAEDILAALEAGDFYASTGVVLEDYQVTPKEIRIQIAPFKKNQFTTTFHGAKGKVLAVEHGPAPVYRFKGDEAYVRAVVHASNGDDAWTQPVFRRR